MRPASAVPASVLVREFVSHDAAGPDPGGASRSRPGAEGILVPVISGPVSLSWPRVAASRSSGLNYLAGAMIAKYFRTYSTIILRREKILRDHGGALG